MLKKHKLKPTQMKNGGAREFFFVCFGFVNQHTKFRHSDGLALVWSSTLRLKMI